MEHTFVFGCEERTGEGVLLPAGRYPGCMELVFVVRGTVVASTAMAHFSAEAGDLFFLPPDMVRTVSAKEGRASVRSLHFPADLLSGITESIDRDLWYMFLTQSRTRDNRVRRDSALHGTVAHCFNECYDEYLTKDLCYSLRIRGHLSMMMASVLASYSGRRENDRAVYHNVLRLRPTLDYIDTHYTEHISVPDLAAYLLVTPDYYTKLFRDSIGKTTVDYINSVRVNESMVLLLETDLAISDVAMKVGLQSGNYFSKLFKSVTGLTPLAFRKLKLRP